MKEKIPLAVAKVCISIFLIFCFSSYLADFIQPKSMVILNFWTYFLCLIIIAGATFYRLTDWEVSTGRVERSTAGPKKIKYLYSGLMLQISGIISLSLLILTLLSLFPAFDNWLGTIWEPLKIFAGWTSILTALFLLFTTLIFHFVREEQIYRPDVKK